MFRLESKILQREYVVHKEEGILYASQIRNVLSGRDFVPDGNSVEFLFHFSDGSEFSSKGLKVVDSKQERNRLRFTFEETEGISVTMTLWAGIDGNTLKKQISFTQTSDKTIEYIMLENVGVVNSKTHFCVPIDVEGRELNGYHSSLGQPFYIDSLFFGCEFPATQNTILYGVGQVKYFLGRKIHGSYSCPVTVVGGAKSGAMIDIQRAFFDYIDSIAVRSDFRVQYNSWYDHMLNIDADKVEKSFFEVENGLASNGVDPLEAYVIDDGWNDYKGDFWNVNTKKFPNKLYDSSQLAQRLGSGFGLWLGPRGGYSANEKFAKRIEKSGKGAYNAQSKDICIADKTYQKNVEEFLIKATKEYDIDYWKLDGFCLSPCTNPNHDHAVGGDQNMYMITEMWQGWINIFKNIRKTRAKLGKSLWINMTCYVNPSPWWLQYVNSIWLQNSDDLGFSDNQENQSQLDRELTYRDSRYYDMLCTRALQFPTRNIYNHEPIYANLSKLDFTDEEFEKYLFFNASRGQALNELYISHNRMNKEKWRSLAKVLQWQRDNYDILKNAIFIGGKPDENNVYGYFSWNDKGDGIIALRNPTDQKAPLTLTLNKFMGCPADLSLVNRYNVYNESGKESFDSYSYGDKVDLVLKPFEVKVFQFGKKDRRFRKDKNTEFTISFNYDGRNNIVIAENDDITIAVEKGYLKVRCDSCNVSSENIVSGVEHKITIVREKNKAIKIYLDKALDSSGFSADAKPEISTELSGDAKGFKIIEKATPYDEIITLKEILGKVGKRKRKNK